MSTFDKIVEKLAGARVLILYLFHAFVFWISYVFAMLARFEFEIPNDQLAGFETSLPLVVGLTTAQLVLLAIWFVGPQLDITSSALAPCHLLSEV